MIVKVKASEGPSLPSRSLACAVYAPTAGSVPRAIKSFRYMWTAHSVHPSRRPQVEDLIGGHDPCDRCNIPKARAMESHTLLHAQWRLMCHCSI